MTIFNVIAWLLKAILTDKAQLAAENIALRQQIVVFKRHAKRPRLQKSDRLFWIWLSALWKEWRFVLTIVKPETVIKWHRQGFRHLWRWKSQPRRTGRPKMRAEIRNLIRKVSQENPLWGAPGIRDELSMLGYVVAKSTVEKYMVRSNRPPPQNWRTFLKNHAGEIVAIDFFTVFTLTFKIFYCFIVFSHSSRRIIHFNITDHPTEQWTAQQVIEAFPWDEAPKYLLRDRDSIFGPAFRRRVKNMGIKQIVISRQSPWQNPYVERVIGSIRRECLDHVIILNERHLHRILTEYHEYYNESRTHLSIDGDSPVGREVEDPDRGKIIAIPVLGGLHHRYKRAA